MIAHDFPGFDAQTFASQGSAILGIRDSGKSYTAVELAERLHDGGIPFVAFDPIGRWRFMRVAGSGKAYPVVVAGGAEGDLPLTVASAPKIVRAAMESGISLIIDLYDIEISKADWKRIVGDSVRVLLYENGAHGLRHIFIEEAAEFAPQRIAPDQGRVYAEIEKLARMGGNARLGYTLVNQRAEEINKAVLELADNLFLHRQKGRNSLTALTKWLDIADVQPGSREIIKSLPTLPQGECWAWMAGTDRPVLVKVPPKNSYEPDRRAMRGEVAVTAKRIDVAAFVAELRGRLGEPAPPHTDDARVVLNRTFATNEAAPAPPPERRPPKTEDPAVKESEARALRDENAALMRRIAALEAGTTPPAAAVPGAPLDMDAIIGAVKAACQNDPGLLHLLTRKPEVVVTIARPIVEIDGGSLKGRIVRLLADGFFDGGATNSGTRSALKRTGPDTNNANIGRILSDLQRDGFLTLEAGNEFKAVPGMKVRIKEAAAA